MSFDFRRDNRDVATFARDIHHFTGCEAIWAEAYRIDHDARAASAGRPRVREILEFGVDNTGAVVFGNVSSNPDKIFVMEDGREFFLEVKTIPDWCRKFMTFKHGPLKRYVEHGAYLLVPYLERHYVFRPIAVRMLQRDFEPTIYEKFSPNDMAVRIQRVKIDEWVGAGLVAEREWTPEAVEFIAPHRQKLASPPRES